MPAFIVIPASSFRYLVSKIILLTYRRCLKSQTLSHVTTALPPEATKFPIGGISIMGHPPHSLFSFQRPKPVTPIFAPRDVTAS